jgi:hypothetical protein
VLVNEEWHTTLRYPQLLPVHVVASKASWNHFNSKKYKTVQSLKLHFLQNSPLMQLYTSTSYCKFDGNIPGGHFVKVFSALPSHS